MQSMQVDTDHGAYDALPTREQDEAPGGAVLSVFCEDGALAGFVAVAHDGTFKAVVAGAGGVSWVTVGWFGTAAGAVAGVADDDAGITV